MALYAAQALSAPVTSSAEPTADQRRALRNITFLSRPESRLGGNGGIIIRDELTHGADVTWQSGRPYRPSEILP